LKLCAARLRAARSRVVTVITNFQTAAQRIIGTVACGQVDGPFWKEWYDNVQNSLGEAARIRNEFDAFLAKEQEYQAGRPIPANFADGAGFAERIRATREQLARLATDTDRRLTGLADQRRILERELEESPRSGENARDPKLVNADLARNAQDTEAAKQQMALYQKLQQRQILYFDPHGDGALVELHGKIDENTKNVGILVPGAKANQFTMQYTADRAEGLVAAAGGDLAMVTALLGDHPNTAVDGLSASYAQDLGPSLAELSHAVRAENVAQGVGDAKMTVLGYSYGSSIVGEAEKAGLTADRILWLGGAGVGHGVGVAADLHNENSNVARYSMTPVGDAIHLSQGREIGNWGHGRIDPDGFPGVTNLSPGRYAPDANGQRLPVEGMEGHINMWQPGSDSWRNILGVLNSGDIRVSRFEPAGPNSLLHDSGAPPIDIDDLERSKRH
jgi:hypothetical protein